MRVGSKMRALGAFLIAGLLAPGVASATPAACADPCNVQTYSFGYVLAAAEIAFGTRVTWVTRDSSHPTSDSTDFTKRCFIVQVGADARVVPVRFTVAGGAVTATTDPGTPEERTARCSTATALPNGAWQIPFRCLLHPYMVGTFVITA